MILRCPDIGHFFRFAEKYELKHAICVKIKCNMPIIIFEV